MTAAIWCARDCRIARRHQADCEHPDDGQCRGCRPTPRRLRRPVHRVPLPARPHPPRPAPRPRPARRPPQPSYARRTNDVKATKGDPPVPLNLNVLDLILEFDNIPSAGPGSTPRSTTSPCPPTRRAPDDPPGVRRVRRVDRRRMGRAHRPRVQRPLPRPLAEEAKRMGAPCPHCHCQALVTYGGDDHVTCQECKAIIGPQEYAIWVARCSRICGRRPREDRRRCGPRECQRGHHPAVEAPRLPARRVHRPGRVALRCGTHASTPGSTHCGNR
jgi:hypothetical protein